MKASEVGLRTWEASVSCGQWCQGGSVYMTPTTYPQHEDAEFVWVRADEAGAKIAALAARLAEADKANQLLRAELAAAAREEDLILIALRLDPERYRTECGFLNVPKIIAAIKNPSMYPRTTAETVSVEGER